MVRLFLMTDTMQSDETLMLDYQKGDQTAFESLYLRYKDSLYRYFIKQTSDTQQSEELYQEVWIKLINNAKNYQATAKFKTYLYTIAHNTLIDFYRKKKPTHVIDFEDAEMNSETEINTSTIALPDDEFTYKQKTKQFVQALNELPSSQKEAIQLLLQEELSVEEIAEITQVKMETAKSRLRYAKNKLKAAIQD